MEDFEFVETDEEPDIIDEKITSPPDISLYLADLEYLKSKKNWAEEYGILSDQHILILIFNIEYLIFYCLFFLYS